MLHAPVQVAFRGVWSPAISNSFSQFTYLFLASYMDDYQDLLNNSLQYVNVESATLIGPATRRLLQQVSALGFFKDSASLAPIYDRPPKRGVSH